MRTKKGLLGALIGIVLLVITFLVFGSVVIKMLKSSYDSTMDLIDKQLDQFNIVAGSYVNPSLDSDFANRFWHGGIMDQIKGAIHYSNGKSTYDYKSCLGSLYVDGKLNTLDSVKLTFIQRDYGILSYFTDSKNVLGALNNDTLLNTQDEEWQLCIIDVYNDQARNFQNYLVEKMHDTSPIDMAELKSKQGYEYVKKIDSITIYFEKQDLREEGSVRAEFNTLKSTLQTQNNQNPTPVFVPYNPYILESTGRSIVPGGKDYLDRAMFFFVVWKDISQQGKKKNYFCLVPSSANDYNDGINLDVLHKSIIGSEKILFYEAETKKAVETVSETLCDLPDISASVFKGKKSCYYYGCADVKYLADQFKLNGKTNYAFIYSFAEQCKGLCTSTISVLTSSFEFVTCNSIDECDDYKIDDEWSEENTIKIWTDFCNADYCNKGCFYDPKNKYECTGG